MDNSVRVGLVGGYRLPGNVRTLLYNIRKALDIAKTSFNCDLIGGSGIDDVDGYRMINPGLGNPGSARKKIIDLAQGLRRYVKNRSPDVLFQLTRFPTHGTAAAIAGSLTRTRTVVRVAGMDFEEFRFASTLSKQLQLFGLKNCISMIPTHLGDDVVALGPEGREALAHRLRHRNVHEVPQPVDTESFSPVSESTRAKIRSKLGMPLINEGRVFLTVGRVSRRKGAKTIQRTAAELAKGQDPIRWYVIGDGPLLDELEATPCVEPLGRLDHESLPDYYRAADIYVHPSLHEGLPNVLLEATACGTPSIARDVGECSLIATETFDQDNQLSKLLRRNYSSVTLDRQFTIEGLANAYETLLLGDLA
ncbi:glycosyltransferase [Salinarchaeum sp. Harcht-Bsk1]|uniref:glycosyltransferase n=1 Tax=Salinarchaeum sp. Harcht-Bsk1 TaxID=1333523 RepID=UPI0009DBF4EC|nr:glycosyltransferase [Salinarchaeum sp. Harcht-Bsk1]